MHHTSAPRSRWLGSKPPRLRVGIGLQIPYGFSYPFRNRLYPPRSEPQPRRAAVLLEPPVPGDDVTVSPRRIARLRQGWGRLKVGAAGLGLGLAEMQKKKNKKKYIYKCRLHCSSIVLALLLVSVPWGSKMRQQMEKQRPKR